jgi:hypothetical protein
MRFILLVTWSTGLNTKVFNVTATKMKTIENSYP